MNSYWALIRTSNQPGAGLIRVTVNADTNFNATQILKGMYGSLLLSESANLI